MLASGKGWGGRRRTVRKSLGLCQSAGVQMYLVAQGNPRTVMSLPATAFGVPEKLQILLEDAPGKWRCWDTGSGASLMLVPSTVPE